MILLDTNVIIYLAKGDLSYELIAKHDIAHSSITKIEALGYSKITAQELLLLSTIFNESYELIINNDVINKAISLRQAKNIRLGDAIIAAKAMVNSVTLWTANTDDFKHIVGLKIYNPLEPDWRNYIGSMDGVFGKNPTKTIKDNKDSDFN